MGSRQHFLVLSAENHFSEIVCQSFPSVHSDQLVRYCHSAERIGYRSLRHRSIAFLLWLSLQLRDNREIHVATMNLPVAVTVAAAAPELAANLLFVTLVARPNLLGLK